MEWRRQSTGSPTATVAEEKLGSSSVHRRIVPAGRIISRALALVVKVRTVKVRRVKVRRRDTTTRARRELDFITSPRSHAPKFLVRRAKATAVSQPRLDSI